jgi:hypothetical protein
VPVQRCADLAGALVLGGVPLPFGLRRDLPGAGQEHPAQRLAGLHRRPRLAATDQVGADQHRLLGEAAGRGSDQQIRLVGQAAVQHLEVAAHVAPVQAEAGGRALPGQVGVPAGVELFLHAGHQRLDGGVTEIVAERMGVGGGDRLEFGVGEPGADVAELVGAQQRRHQIGSWADQVARAACSALWAFSRRAARWSRTILNSTTALAAIASSSSLRWPCSGASTVLGGASWPGWLAQNAVSCGSTIAWVTAAAGAAG